MRILPLLRNTYKGALWNKRRLVTFTTEGLRRGLNLGPFDPKLDALTTRLLCLRQKAGQKLFFLRMVETISSYKWFSLDKNELIR